MRVYVRVWLPQRSCCGAVCVRVCVCVATTNRLPQFTALHHKTSLSLCLPLSLFGHKSNFTHHCQHLAQPLPFPFPSLARSLFLSLFVTLCLVHCLQTIDQLGRSNLWAKTQSVRQLSCICRATTTTTTSSTSAKHSYSKNKTKRRCSLSLSVPLDTNVPPTDTHTNCCKQDKFELLISILCCTID